jgi:hypothetical protein
VAFEFVIVAGLVASLAAGFYHRTRLSFLGLVSIAALLYIQATDSFLTAESVSRYDGGSLLHRARTTTAGFLMTAVANAALVIVLGLEPCSDAAPKAGTDTVQASAV